MKTIRDNDIVQLPGCVTVDKTTALSGGARLVRVMVPLAAADNFTVVLPPTNECPDAVVTFLFRRATGTYVDGGVRVQAHDGATFADVPEGYTFTEDGQAVWVNASGIGWARADGGGADASDADVTALDERVDIIEEFVGSPYVSTTVRFTGAEAGDNVKIANYKAVAVPGSPPGVNGYVVGMEIVAFVAVAHDATTINAGEFRVGDPEEEGVDVDEATAANFEDAVQAHYGTDAITVLQGSTVSVGVKRLGVFLQVDTEETDMADRVSLIPGLIQIDPNTPIYNQTNFLFSALIPLIARVGIASDEADSDSGASLVSRMKDHEERIATLETFMTNHT